MTLVDVIKGSLFRRCLVKKDAFFRMTFKFLGEILIWNVSSLALISDSRSIVG